MFGFFRLKIVYWTIDFHVIPSGNAADNILGRDLPFAPTLLCSLDAANLQNHIFLRRF